MPVFCPSCKVWKSPKDFNPSPWTRSRRQAVCSSCFRCRGGYWGSHPSPRREEAAKGYLTCPKCRKKKPLDAFWASKTNHGSVKKQARCKECMRSDYKEWGRKQSEAKYGPTPLPGYRRCYKCKKTKPEQEFPSQPPQAKRKSVRCSCNDCIKKTRRKEGLRKSYGLTEDQYHEILKRQGNACAVCGSKGSGSSRHTSDHLYVDHCHRTNQIRGLLCHHCNAGIGHFKDDPILLEAAATYLLKSASQMD